MQMANSGTSHLYFTLIIYCTCGIWFCEWMSKRRAFPAITISVPLASPLPPQGQGHPKGPLNASFAVRVTGVPAYLFTVLFRVRFKFTPNPPNGLTPTRLYSI